MLPRYLDRDLPQLHNWTWLLVRTVIEEVKVSSEIPATNGHFCTFPADHLICWHLLNLDMYIAPSEDAWI